MLMTCREPVANTGNDGIGSGPMRPRPRTRIRRDTPKRQDVELRPSVKTAGVGSHQLEAILQLNHHTDRG